MRPSLARRPRCTRGATLRAAARPAGPVSSSIAWSYLTIASVPALSPARHAKPARGAVSFSPMLRPVMSCVLTTSKRSTQSPEAQEFVYVVTQAETVRNPGHLSLLGALAVAVGLERGAFTCCLRPQVAEPRPKVLESDQLSGLDVGVPGGERHVATRRHSIAPISQQRAPQIAAVVGVLHVHVDLDVGAGHGDHMDTALAVGGRRPDSGTGQLNLPGRIRRTRRAHGERLRIDHLEVAHRLEAVPAQDLGLLGPVRDDIS